MNETIYVPANQTNKFEIRFRDNIRTSNKMFTFFHATKFISKIFTTGGKWWHTSIFLIFQLFIFFPFAFIFDLLILLVTGFFYLSWLLLLTFLKKIIKWLGIPIVIILSVVTLFALAVIIYYHFSDFVQIIVKKINTINYGSI